MTDMTEIMFLTLTDWVYFFFINFILNCSLQCTIEMQKREHIHYLEVFIEFCVIHIHIYFFKMSDLFNQMFLNYVHVHLLDEF